MKKTRLAAAFLAAVMMISGVPKIIEPLTFSACAASKLSAPTGFKAKTVTESSIKLTWDKVKGADAYRVFMFDNDTDEYEPYGTVTGNVCTVKELSTETVYKFKVAALVKSNGKYSVQTKSSKISVKTKSEAKLPAPKNIKSTSTSSQIKITWNEVENADAYRIYLYDESSDSFETYKSVTGTSCTIKDLEPDTKYKFKIASLLNVDGKYKVQTSTGALSTTTKPEEKSSGSDVFRAPGAGATVDEVKKNCNVTDLNFSKTTSAGDSLYIGKTLFAGKNSIVVFTFNKNGKLSLYSLTVPSSYSEYSKMLSTLKESLGNGYELELTDDNYLEYQWIYTNEIITIHYNDKYNYTSLGFGYFKYII